MCYLKLLNKYEEVVYKRLGVITKDHGARVFAKVRIADVFQLERVGLSDDLFAFGLKAHFDFTVTRRDTTPLFAVEFDGPLHKSSKDQIQRDKKKDTIANKTNFPILHINSRYIDKSYRGLDLLAYFVNIWFLSGVFEKAQNDGIIPYDEPFDPCFIVNDGRSAKSFPYWLSVDVEKKIVNLKKAKKIKDDFVCYWVGVDLDGNYICFAWLRVGDAAFIVAQTNMRKQNFPVMISDVLPQITKFDIWQSVQLYSLNNKNTVSGDYIKNKVDKLRERYRMCAFCGKGQVEINGGLELP